MALATATMSTPALACSCARSTPQDAFKDYHVVFTARIERVQSILLPAIAGLLRFAIGEAKAAVGIEDDPSETPQSFRKVTIRPLAVYKGGPVRSVVRTGLGDGDCGVPFEVGRTYFIYGLRDPETDVWVDLCSRTRPIEEAGEDLHHVAQLRAARETH